MQRLLFFKHSFFGSRSLWRIALKSHTPTRSTCLLSKSTMQNATSPPLSSLINESQWPTPFPLYWNIHDVPKRAADDTCCDLTCKSCPSNVKSGSNVLQSSAYSVISGSDILHGRSVKYNVTAHSAIFPVVDCITMVFLSVWFRFDLCKYVVFSSPMEYSLQIR